MKQEEVRLEVPTHTMPGVEELTKLIEPIQASMDVRIRLFPHIVAKIHDKELTALEIGEALYCAFDIYIDQIGEIMRNVQIRYLYRVVEKLLDDKLVQDQVIAQLREITNTRHASQAA